MKTNKVTKLGVSLLSVAVLGVVAPALTDVPVFGVSIVKADENQEPLKYRITYYDIETRERLGQMTGVINPGQTINIYKKFNGHEIISKDEWMPNYDMTYDIVNEYFYGSSDGYNDLRLEYKKVEEPTPTPTPKPEVKPEPKPSETPKPEVKPSEKPEAEEQEPIKYLIDYLDADTGEEITHEMGVLNPGETINIYKNIDGYEVVTNRSWMPDFNVDYRTMNRHFGFADGRQYTFLRYKKVNADAKPSDTSKPEVKPEPAPKAEEKQEPLKYRITYYGNEAGEKLGQITGTINPGKIINIYKHFDGYEITSKYSWMPNYDMTYDIANEYFYGSRDGYNDMFLEYKKVNADAKPSDTPKPEVKPETKPSETPKPEVKPETKPSDTSKPEVKPETKPSETPKPEVKPEPKPSDTSKPEVKPAPKPSDTSKPEVKPAPKPSETPKPEVKPAPKPSETPKPEVKPEPKPSDTSKPEVKPETKPSDTSKPEVKPAPKPSETPKPEVKPAPKPSDTPKPEVKPEPKPSDTSKPEVKPETKPSDTSKPEVKPELKPQTNSNTAPTAPVKPVGQTSNSKADKPTSKKETPALPNTGEQSSSLSLVGLLIASLGLAGLTYKGRH